MRCSSLLRFARSFWFFGLVFGIFISTPVYAYLDPGSGSFFVQILIAMLVVIPLTFKSIGIKISAFLKKIFRGGKQDPDSKNSP